MFLSLRLYMKIGPGVNNCGRQMLAIAATACMQQHFWPTIAVASSKQYEQATLPHSLHCHADIEVDSDTFEKRPTHVSLRS